MKNNKWPLVDTLGQFDPDSFLAPSKNTRSWKTDYTRSDQLDPVWRCTTMTWATNDETKNTSRFHLLPEFVVSFLQKIEKIHRRPREILKNVEKNGYSFDLRFGMDGLVFNRRWATFSHLSIQQIVCSPFFTLTTLSLRENESGHNLRVLLILFLLLLLLPATFCSSS